MVVIMKSVIENKSLLKHPFYVLWLEGKLPKESLQKYTAQYFQLVDFLPRFITTLHSRCDDENVRKQLTKNLLEEESGEGNGNISHTELWLDFAEELGVNREKVKKAELLPETKEAVNKIMELCESSMLEGAAALYAYESQVPRIAEEKIKGLEQFYGITSEKAQRFFKIHALADVKHGAVWKALVSKYAKTPYLEHKAFQSAKETAEALWNMFDGMFENFVPEEVKVEC